MYIPLQEEEVDYFPLAWGLDLLTGFHRADCGKGKGAARHWRPTDTRLTSDHGSHHR